MKKIFTLGILKNKSAFTLAETLITLVIVGVIAAITVPSLIAKYQEKQLKTQFGKAYSTMTQALNKTVMLDYSGSVNCYYSDNKSIQSECNTFFESFAKNLIISKTCKSNAKNNGCVPQYSSYNTDSKNCGCASEYWINIGTDVYVLAGGQILITYCSSGMPLFFVDINGFKGPNKPGYDLFSFNIYNNKSGYYINDGWCIKAEKGGKSTKTMIRSFLQ